MIGSIFCLHVDGSITGRGQACKRQFAVGYQCQ